MNWEHQERKVKTRKKSKIRVLWMNPKQKHRNYNKGKGAQIKWIGNTSQYCQCQNTGEWRSMERYLKIVTVTFHCGRAVLNVQFVKSELNLVTVGREQCPGTRQHWLVLPVVVDVQGLEYVRCRQVLKSQCSSTVLLLPWVTEIFRENLKIV